MVQERGGWGLAPPKSLPDPGPATIGLSRRLWLESLEFVCLGKPDDPAGRRRPRRPRPGYGAVVSGRCPGELAPGTDDCPGPDSESACLRLERTLKSVRP